MARDTTYTKLGEYRGHTILIDDHTLRFRAEFGPDDFAIADTAEGLKALIDDRLKTVAKAIKLSLPVLTCKGDVAHITGLHMGTSQMLGEGLMETGRMHDVVYPVVPWVVEALTEQIRLQAELDVLDERLREVCIDLSRGYGHVDSVAYIDLVRAFEAEHAAMWETAMEAQS